MVNVKVLGLVAAAFIASSLVASPEFRAFAAATIGSADIIDGSIQSVDIKNGQVKTADLAGSSVTSAKIKDGTIQVSDTSFLKRKVLLHNADGNAVGFIPGTDPMVIRDPDVHEDTFILGLKVSNDVQTTECTYNRLIEGSFENNCGFLDDANRLEYLLLNP